MPFSHYQFIIILIILRTSIEKPSE